MKLAALIEALSAVSERLPLVFAVHPRTRGNIEKAGLGEKLASPNLLAVASRSPISPRSG